MKDMFSVINYKFSVMIAFLFYGVSPVFASHNDGQSATGRVGDVIVDEMVDFIEFVMYIIRDYIIEPPMRIFKNFFQGLSTTIYAVGAGMFSGAEGVMNTAWQILANFLSFTGPFAPVLASVIIWTVLAVSFWFITDIILDMLIPKPKVIE